MNSEPIYLKFVPPSSRFLASPQRQRLILDDEIRAFSNRNTILQTDLTRCRTLNLHRTRGSTAEGNGGTSPALALRGGVIAC